MRWSATQEMTGPSIATEPMTAQRAAQPAARLEAAVGEVAVEADGHAQAGDDVHDPEDDDVAPVQQAVPHLPPDDAEREERHDGDDAGDDPVPRLVRDGLDVVRRGSIGRRGWGRLKLAHSGIGRP